jgi:hypothetical protein
MRGRDIHPMAGKVRAMVLSLVAVLLSHAASAQTCNTADRTIALILDASGSMNAALPHGETRIQVARRAIKDVAAAVPGEAGLSLRLYGAQSPRDEKNCQDTSLVVPFGKASASAGPIAAQVDGLKAQGWTPIALALEQAAADFPADAKEKIIVLVSDGKETCAGDPCAAGKALAGTGITLHTVGFIADSAARMQLQCAAKATGGTYFDAPVGPELPETLIAALSACKTELALPKKKGPGTLRTSAASGVLEVRNSETGEVVGDFDAANWTLKLPAGIYEVSFGPAVWKGIEVKAEEETLIEPGVLRLEDAVWCYGGCEVIDSETGDSFAVLDPRGYEVAVPPGVYDIRFGPIAWRYIKVDGGAKTVMTPAVIKGAPEGAMVKDAAGTEVVSFNAVYRNTVLPPGDYVLVVDGQEFPMSLAAGQVLEVQ